MYPGTILKQVQEDMFPHNLNIIYDDIVQSDKNACQKSRETKETSWKHPGERMCGNLRKCIATDIIEQSIKDIIIGKVKKVISTLELKPKKSKLAIGKNKNMDIIRMDGFCLKSLFCKDKK